MDAKKDLLNIQFNITKETLKNNDIEVIVDSANALQLNEKNIEEKLGHKNLPAIINKFDKYTKNTDMNQQINQ